MLKKRILIIGLLVLPFVFLMFSNNVVAERRECWKGPGGGPSISGNFQIPPGWLCQCPPTVAFEFDDDSTADTITPTNGSGPGSIEVYVTGGCGPFTFSTSSTGYYWGAGLSQQSLETTERHATLYCDGVGNS